MTTKTQTGAAASMKAAFLLQRETKGALLYNEIESVSNPKVKQMAHAIIGNVYLRKSAFDIKGLDYPTTIEIEIRPIG